jgi:hypothetical protein
MAQAKLTTLFSLEEEIELPETCPQCGADLRSHHALRAWEWADQSRPARLPADGEKPDYGGVVYDWEGDLDGGDSTIDRTGYYCKECDKTLAEAPCWSLDVDKRTIDARLQLDEDQAVLDCGCILRREPVRITWCKLHAAMFPLAVRHRQQRLCSVVTVSSQAEERR